MSYSCSDFTDDVLLTLKGSKMLRGRIPPDNPERQAVLAMNAISKAAHERAILLKALHDIVDLAPEEEPEPETYDDTESAYNNGEDVAAWERATIAKIALKRVLDAAG